MNEDKKLSKQTVQNLVMENRRNPAYQVLKVKFDDETVIETELGVLIVWRGAPYCKLNITIQNLVLRVYHQSEYNDNDSRFKVLASFQNVQIEDKD